MWILFLLLSTVLLGGCPESTKAEDMRGDMARLSCCGKPGDKGNSLGFGKYCEDQRDCIGVGHPDGGAVCSTLGDTAERKTNFCTFGCVPDGGAEQCGEGVVCRCTRLITGAEQCGCTPESCLRDLPPGCPPG